MDPSSVGSPLMWGGFTLLVFSLLALDLGVFHRKVHEIRSREALIWSLVWIGISLLFCLGVSLKFGSERGLEFLTGFLIEKALSVDNIFVFVVLFSFFAVPPYYQHRVLFWGILGAMLMRMIFIVAGAALIQRFGWIIFIFGAFLIYTGFKIIAKPSEEVHPENNRILKLFRKFVPMVFEYHGPKFWIYKEGKWFATPLLLVLVVVEATDVVFAVDSIPAIFAVTTDPFIVYTSNIFAILGLRSLYFLLARVIKKFYYLKYGLGLVLVFVGMKMLISEFYKIPIAVSLMVIGCLLTASILLSWIRPVTAPISTSEKQP